MTLKRHRQLILIGFVMAYVGGMFSLAALSFDQFGVLAIQTFLAPVGVMGCVLIAIAMIGSIEDASES